MKLLEHLPFVLATSGGGPQLDLKDLIGAIVVGAVSALGSSYITTKEMAVEVRMLAEQVREVKAKVESSAGMQMSLSDRIARVEAMGGMNGDGKRK